MVKLRGESLKEMEEIEIMKEKKLSKNSRGKFMAKFIFNLILIALTSYSSMYDNNDNHLLLNHSSGQRGKNKKKNLRKIRYSPPPFAVIVFKTTRQTVPKSFLPKRYPAALQCT